MKKFMQRKKKGFTLVELMVVVAIIAVLVMLAVPRLAGNSEKAKMKVFESNFRTLVSDVTMASTTDKPDDEVKIVAEKAKAMNGRPEGTVTYEVGKIGTAYGVKATWDTYVLLFNTSTGQTTVSGGLDASSGTGGKEGASFKNVGSTADTITPIS